VAGKAIASNARKKKSPPLRLLMLAALLGFTKISIREDAPLALRILLLRWFHPKLF
jgi:hypothetical protein